MATQKKIMTKGQIVTHFAEKFEVSKKAAAAMIDDYAALAIAETKKKGICAPRHWEIRSRQKEGPNRPEPCHRRNDQDSAKTVVRIRPAKPSRKRLCHPRNRHKTRRAGFHWELASSHLNSAETNEHWICRIKDIPNPL